MNIGTRKTVTRLQTVEAGRSSSVTDRRRKMVADGWMLARRGGRSVNIILATSCTNLMKVATDVVIRKTNSRETRFTSYACNKALYQLSHPDLQAPVTGQQTMPEATPLFQKT